MLQGNETNSPEDVSMNQLALLWWTVLSVDTYEDVRLRFKLDV